MKFLRFIIVALTVLSLFSSCQKEFSSEAGNAHGSLKADVTGDCLPILIHGNFKKDSVVKDTNYAQIQVNITQTGTYFIKTDTVNGYSFSAAGVASVTGSNTIRLRPSGKPIAPGVDVFTVKFDTSQCQFNVTVTGTGGGGGGGTAAVFTLAGSPTTCTGATQTNNFYATIPTTPANTVTVFADVQTAGTFTISASTTPGNGLTFSGSGTLAQGNNQPIVLVADGGQPSTMGPIPYTFTSTTTTPPTNCGFNLTVQAAPSPATYSFDCSAPSYTGTYQQGVSTAGNTVTIMVTSIAGGSYNITSAGTASSNNVTFTGSGVLSASPTPQPVTLFASSGLPAVQGMFTYTLTGGTGATGTCTIDQTYSAAPVSNGTITAFINGSTTLTTFNINASGSLNSSGGNSSLLISGDNSSASNTSTISLSVDKAGSITPGNYTASSTTMAATGQYDDTMGTMFLASALGGTITISITSITTTAPLRVVGTFSGTLKDNFGMGTNTTTFTGGNFDVPYQ